MASSQTFDLVIVGGGINGVGIARDAAGRGLKVLLCERDDLASHTSSWSSKLIHGGLRYLEYYEFRLVREALIEREVLLRASPNLIKPMEFVLPHSTEQRPRWMIRMGLFLYDNLGGRKLLPGSKSVDLSSGPLGEPLKKKFAKGFTYADAWVDDSRLVALNALDAAERGAEVLTRNRCTSARRANGHWAITLKDETNGAERSVQARGLVNAAGPWVSSFIKEAVAVESRHRVRLVKGSHIVVPKLFDHGHPYILQNDDKRIVFAIPYLSDYTLIGTTDLTYEGDPAEAEITEEETSYLCRVINRYFERQIGADDVVWTYSGVRPLYDDASGNPSAVTRDYVFDLDTDGGAPLLSVFGGKLTTYRKLAEHALQKLKPVMAIKAGDWTASAKLPGGDIEDADFPRFLAGVRERYPWLGDQLAARLARAYGTRIERVLGTANKLEDLGGEMGAGLYEAELDYLRKVEWAREPEDILWRRTKLGLFMSDEEAARVRAWCMRNQAEAA
ncbi:MAG: glycerol-3-phosphate dehydrogenase [Geminicoccaceae bacterium]